MTNNKEDFDEDKEPLNRDCDCPGWKKSMRQINDAQMLAYNHGASYTGDFFTYCPWCGTQIRGKKSDPSPDKFCLTLDDGSCISTDPRCIHHVRPNCVDHKTQMDEGFAKWMMTTKRKSLNPAWMMCNKEAFEEGYRTALEKDKS